MRKILLTLFIILGFGRIAYADSYGGGGNITPTLFGTQCYYSGNTTSGALISGVVGKRFFITSVVANLRDGSTFTGGGNITFSLQDNGTNIVQNVLYVPTSAVTATNPYPIFNIYGWNYISIATNNPLNIIFSSALTTGAVDITVCGGYTTSAP